MVVRCYCCKKRFKSELEQCPRCNFKNLKPMNWLPEDLKVKHGENQKSLIDPPTISEIETYTRQAAEQCQFEIEELTVTDQHFDGLLEVMLPEDNIHKFTINYNPKKMARHSINEILAMLRHEIMHPITMQEASKIMVSEGIGPEIQQFQSGVQLAYDEMINHKEYVKRFPCDKYLQSSQERMFTNFSVIFLTAKYMVTNNIMPPNHPSLFVQVLNIYQDAVYNFFEEKNKLIEWSESNKAQALYKFWQWIHEDFNLIHENTSTRDEMREIIFLTFSMMATISIDLVLISNEIQFNQMWTTAYTHCQKNYSTPLGSKLLELWMDRFNGAPYVY